MSPSRCSAVLAMPCRRELREIFARPRLKDGEVLEFGICKAFVLSAAAAQFV